MTAYDALMRFQRETEALSAVAERLAWDQETMMPRAAADQRGEESAAMEAVLHARRTDPRLAEWLEAIDDTALDATAQAQLRLIRRGFARASRVPADLVAALARQTSVAFGVWAQARAADDMAAFAPTLTDIVRLKREEGQALADGGDVYDALLDDYEPGASSAELSRMFDALRPPLVALRERVLDRPAPATLQGRFDAAAQLELSRGLAQAFGFDLDGGRIDMSVHPFSSGGGRDVRITTRTLPEDPFNCIYSTIHETGHGCYEQNIDAAYQLTPLGHGVSMGVHESQSRIYENQLGRSRAFTGWLFARARDTFGDIGVADETAFYAAANGVHRGYIRTEADEVQYNLHILLRFDLEQALIRDNLQVGDLEAAWNDRFAADFGYAVDKPSNGVLQDVHWAAGLFGYFPTYTLGNVYAGCLHAALRADLPDLDAQMAQGDLSAATGWLRDKVQRHGGLYSPRDLMTRACGTAPSEAPLLDYLESKYSALYGV